ncbi:MAG TPA: hypothetical protein VMW12_00370 [Candidatus Dormibacteraeota bacterium]|nr:hypothetical protein [Candidatus Dormibacteraeota bacterium]
MNREPDFDASADMRLIELQRSALGLAIPDRASWQSRLSSEPALGLDEPDQPAPQGAVIVVEISASPARGVIPGAVVSVGVSLANEGAHAARAIEISVPIPGASSYRGGSFERDGRPSDDRFAESLFGPGLTIESIPRGGRVTLLWKLGVKLGSQPLILAPQVRAQGAAVVGAKPISISRKGQSVSAFSADLARADASFYDPRPLIPVDIPADELPIYELDEEEQLVYEAANAALSSAVEPPAEIVPAVVAPQPKPEPEPQPVAAAVPEPPREAIVLYGRFDRTTLAFFARTFNGSKPPTMLQHCIFASALACSVDGNRADASGIKQHLDAQSQVLHRVVLHEKLGKREPIGDYTGDLLARLEALVPHPVLDVDKQDDAVVLATELSAPTMQVVRRIADERERWDFVRARQLTLALQAQGAAHVTDPGASAALENALRAYAQTSMTALQRLFVRIRLDRTTGILFAPEPSLDAAARSLLAAFETLLR